MQSVFCTRSACSSPACSIHETVALDFCCDSTICRRFDLRKLSLASSEHHLPSQIRQSPDNGLKLYHSGNASECVKSADRDGSRSRSLPRCSRGRAKLPSFQKLLQVST